MKGKPIWGAMLLLSILFCLCACGTPSTEDTEATQPSAAGTVAATEEVTPPEEEPAAAAAPDTAQSIPAVAADGVHPQLIAHAGGAIYGYLFTNSLEALNHSYEEGFRYMEVDLNKTSDDALVLIHDWDSYSQRIIGRTGPCTLKEFQDAHTMADLTLLTLDDLLDWLRSHPDCFIVTDIKWEDNCSMLEDLSRQAGDLKSRFIPQAFSYAEYDTIRDLGFDRVILTLYRISSKNLNIDELIQFARDKSPWAITISEERLSKALISPLAKESIAVYGHSVNSVDTVDTWHQYGLTGIYTDYFLPSHWIY